MGYYAPTARHSHFREKNLFSLFGFLRIFHICGQKSANLNFSQNVATAITHVPGVPFFALTRTVPALRAAPSKSFFISTRSVALTSGSNNHPRPWGFFGKKTPRFARCFFQKPLDRELGHGDACITRNMLISRND